MLFPQIVLVLLGTALLAQGWILICMTQRLRLVEEVVNILIKVVSDNGLVNPTNGDLAPFDGEF